MIQNTPHEQNSWENIPGLYVPPDPKYIYYVDRYNPSAAYQQNDLQQTRTGFLDDIGIEGIFDQNQEVIDSKIQLLYIVPHR